MSLEEFFEDESTEVEETEAEKQEWREHWVGMPEFVQEAKKPYKVLNIRFETEEDYNAFAELIGQKLTPKTKSIWHPALQRGLNTGIRWVDESEES